MLSDIVKQILILFVPSRCYDSSAYTDLFNKLLVPDWLCGVLIHLDVLVLPSAYIKSFSQCVTNNHISFCIYESKSEYSYLYWPFFVNPNIFVIVLFFLQAEYIWIYLPFIVNPNVFILNFTTTKKYLIIKFSIESWKYPESKNIQRSQRTHKKSNQINKNI